jgi:hypothetical protein
MRVRRYLTFAVDMDLPDNLADDGERDTLVESVVGECDFSLAYDDGEGTKIVDYELHSYEDEEPE